MTTEIFLASFFVFLLGVLVGYISGQPSGSTLEDKAKQLADGFRLRDDEEGIMLSVAILRHLITAEERELLEDIQPPPKPKIYPPAEGDDKAFQPLD